MVLIASIFLVHVESGCPPCTPQIVILDEDEAGQVGREDIANRLSKFCFVRVHQFPRPDMEPEHLTDDELADIVEGIK